jgi:hypothetical protein
MAVTTKDRTFNLREAHGTNLGESPSDSHVDPQHGAGNRSAYPDAGTQLLSSGISFVAPRRFAPRQEPRRCPARRSRGQRRRALSPYRARWRSCSAPPRGRRRHRLCLSLPTPVYPPFWLAGLLQIILTRQDSKHDYLRTQAICVPQSFNYLRDKNRSAL